MMKKTGLEMTNSGIDERITRYGTVVIDRTSSFVREDSWGSINTISERRDTGSDETFVERDVHD